jgi:hypothetical protein
MLRRVTLRFDEVTLRLIGDAAEGLRTANAIVGAHNAVSSRADAVVVRR